MYKRILVPIDGSAVSMSGLDEAIRIAKHSGAKVRILHVVDGIAFTHMHSAFTADADKYRQAGKQLMKDVLPEVSKSGVDIEPSIVDNLSGRASDTIIKEAKKWRADLIVMGTHGRRGFNRFVLGSDAEIVIRAAGTPVLLVRSSKKGWRVSKKRAA